MEFGCLFSLLLKWVQIFQDKEEDCLSLEAKTEIRVGNLDSAGGGDTPPQNRISGPGDELATVFARASAFVAAGLLTVWSLWGTRVLQRLLSTP